MTLLSQEFLSKYVAARCCTYCMTLCMCCSDLFKNVLGVKTCSTWKQYDDHPTDLHSVLCWVSWRFLLAEFAQQVAELKSQTGWGRDHCVNKSFCLFSQLLSSWPWMRHLASNYLNEIAYNYSSHWLAYCTAAPSICIQYVQYVLLVILHKPAGRCCK